MNTIVFMLVFMILGIAKNSHCQPPEIMQMISLRRGSGKLYDYASRGPFVTVPRGLVPKNIASGDYRFKNTVEMRAWLAENNTEDLKKLDKFIKENEEVISKIYQTQVAQAQMTSPGEGLIAGAAAFLERMLRS